MDINSIQTAITTLGFPVVMVVALCWFIKIFWEKTQAQNEKREDKLYEVIAKAQSQNDRLSQTNAEFVSVLNTYKNDLEAIKSDVSDIKQQLN